MALTQYKSVVFVPFVDDVNINGYYYKATLREDNNTSHYILLYGVGVHPHQEPKSRWIMLDITEYHSSEDRGHSETIMNAVETYDSMHYILSYIGDVYNAETKFKQRLKDDKRYYE